MKKSAIAPPPSRTHRRTNKRSRMGRGQCALAGKSWPRPTGPAIASMGMAFGPPIKRSFSREPFSTISTFGRLLLGNTHFSGQKKLQNSRAREGGGYVRSAARSLPPPPVLMPNATGNERDVPQVMRIYSQSRCRILLVPSAPPFLEFLRFHFSS